MLQPCSIQPNMMGAPWLDCPSKITEAELQDLETNYESMLETIRNDTFGGVPPPKYNLNELNDFTNNHNKRYLDSFDIYPKKNKVQKRPNRNNDSIHIFNDNDQDHSGLDISFNHNHNHNQSIQSSSNNNNNLLSFLDFHNNSHANPHPNDQQIQDLNNNYQQTQQAFNRHEINLSVQRVRMQLTMASSPSLSPIPHSTNNSIIDINLNDISRSMNEYKMDHEAEIDEQKQHDISLPFLSPSINNDDSIHSINTSMNPPQSQSNIFISQSISPQLFNHNNPINVNGRSQSEQPLLQHTHHHPVIFSSVPPPNSNHGNHNNHNRNNNHANDHSFDLPILPPAPPPMPISLQQLEQSQSQILQHFGIPDSVTSSMLQQYQHQQQQQQQQESFGSNLNYNSSSNFDINHNQQSLLNYNGNNNRNRNQQRNINMNQPPAAPQRRRNRHRRSNNRINHNHRNNQSNLSDHSNNNNFFRMHMINAFNDSHDSSEMNLANHDIHNLSSLQQLNAIQHDLSSDPIDSLSFHSTSQTPTNLQQRSQSVSLEAPRPNRRQQNRREHVSSLDLTQNNINL